MILIFSVVGSFVGRLVDKRLGHKVSYHGEYVRIRPNVICVTAY